MCDRVLRASGFKAAASKGIVTDVHWSLRENNKAPWCDAGEDFYHQVVDAFRRVTL